MSVNKALVTQASWPSLWCPFTFPPLQSDEEKGPEDCIEQMDRLFRERHLDPQPDEAGRIRIDDWEMAGPVQEAVVQAWEEVTTENLAEFGDFEGYQSSFLRLFGFGLAGVDYDAETDPPPGPIAFLKGDLKVPGNRVELDLGCRFQHALEIRYVLSFRDGARIIPPLS